jgi:hypothetical protein
MHASKAVPTFDQLFEPLPDIYREKLAALDDLKKIPAVPSLQRAALTKASLGPHLVVNSTSLMYIQQHRCQFNITS